MHLRIQEASLWVIPKCTPVQTLYILKPYVQWHIILYVQYLVAILMRFGRWGLVPVSESIFLRSEPSESSFISLWAVSHLFVCSWNNIIIYSTCMQWYAQKDTHTHTHTNLIASIILGFLIKLRGERGSSSKSGQLTPYSITFSVIWLMSLSSLGMPGNSSGHSTTPLSMSTVHSEA